MNRIASVYAAPTLLVLSLWPATSAAQPIDVSAAVNVGVACLDADSRWCGKGSHPVVGAAAGLVFAGRLDLSVVSSFTFTEINIADAPVPSGQEERWSYLFLVGRALYSWSLNERAQILAGGSLGSVRERYTSSETAGASWRLQLGGDAGLRYRASDKFFIDAFLHLSPLPTARVPLMATIGASVRFGGDPD